MRLRKDCSTIFATSDKGVGPFAVAFERYIPGAFHHLQDEYTCTINPAETEHEDKTFKLPSSAGSTDTTRCCQMTLDNSSERN
jgi:hypothetical protein